MKKILVLFLLAAFMMLGQGCQLPTSGGATTVTFVIDFSYLSAHPSVRVHKVLLTRHSDASQYYSICAIPGGSTEEVSVEIPEGGNYTVRVQDEFGSYYASWSSVALTLGQTYSIVLKGDGTSTLDSAIRTNGQIW
jgi:hypothetical protein